MSDENLYANLDPYYSKYWKQSNYVYREGFKKQVYSAVGVFGLFMLVTIIVWPINETSVKKEHPAVIRTDTHQMRMEAEAWGKHYLSRDAKNKK